MSSNSTCSFSQSRSKSGIAGQCVAETDGGHLSSPTRKHIKSGPLSLLGDSVKWSTCEPSSRSRRAGADRLAALSRPNVREIQRTVGVPRPTSHLRVVSVIRNGCGQCGVAGVPRSFSFLGAFRRLHTPTRAGASMDAVHGFDSLTRKTAGAPSFFLGGSVTWRTPGYGPGRRLTSADRRNTAIWAGLWNAREIQHAGSATRPISFVPTLSAARRS